jgi:RNA polymerase sigma-70 factor (ECF subfamily)
MHDATDHALLERIRGRDESAMATLYDKYHRLVYTVSLRILGQAEAAEDLLQEVFLRVWRKPDMQVSANGMAAWFAVVARNRSIDKLRQRRHTVDVDDAVVEAYTGVVPHFDRDRLAAQARSALAHVSADQQQAIQMAIAERTGMPLGTVKTRIRSAIASLRKAMAA